MNELARGVVDGEPIHVGDQVMIRAEVLQSRAGVGALVRLFSETDEMKVWIAPDHLRYAVVEHDLPPEPPNGTWLYADGSQFDDGNSRIFQRNDAEGHADKPERRHDRHWYDVVDQRWIDWPHAVDRGAARAYVRRMVVLAAEQTGVDVAGLDEAMHTCWLEGKWEWMTQKMSAEAREAAAAAVERYHQRIDPGDGPVATLRWWQ